MPKPTTNQERMKDGENEKTIEEGEIEEIYPLSNEQEFELENQNNNKNEGRRLRKEAKSGNKRKISSPRKKGKGKLAKLKKCLNLERRSKDEDRSSLSALSAERSGSNKEDAPAVTFGEEENEYVEMEVQGEDEFLNEIEGNETENNEKETDSSDEEDGEVSFNNNASLREQTDSSIKKKCKTSDANQNSGRQFTRSEEEERESRIINRTVEKLQELMASGGYFFKPVPAKGKGEPRLSKDLGTKGKWLNCTQVEPCGSTSESTIYKNAVKPFNPGDNLPYVDDLLTLANLPANLLRISSSSEEEEHPGTDIGDQTNMSNQINEFLCQVRNTTHNDANVSGAAGHAEPIPSTSRDTRMLIGFPAERAASLQQHRQIPQPQLNRNIGHQGQQVLEQNVSRLIREAEMSKGRVLDPQGNGNWSNPQQPLCEGVNVTNQLNAEPNDQFVLFGPNQLMRMAIMDEDYLIVAAHVEESVEKRIRNCEYVDFVRLLPRDRVQMQQDNRLEIINQNGHLTCAPLSESASSNQNITSFARWEQAFRVFSNIYMRQFPSCASELIQYNHVVHTASLTFAWSNVYAYDIDFRLHMVRHPQRSWLVILQQAWNLRLKDRNEGGRGNANSNNNYNNKRREICFRFNAGKCTYGSKCKFDHRCGICGKFGHGAFQCRRASFDNNEKWDKFDKHHDRKDKKRDNGSKGGNGGSSAISV